MKTLWYCPQSYSPSTPPGQSVNSRGNCEAQKVVFQIAPVRKAEVCVRSLLEGKNGKRLSFAFKGLSPQVACHKL